MLHAVHARGIIHRDDGTLAIQRPAGHCTVPGMKARRLTPAWAAAAISCVAACGGAKMAATARSPSAEQATAAGVAVSSAAAPAATTGEAAPRAPGPAAAVARAAAPVLRATRSGANVIISWPASASGYAVQSTENLGANAAWTTVSEPIFQTPEEYTVTVPAAKAKQFFRLVQP